MGSVQEQTVLPPNDAETLAAVAGVLQSEQSPLTLAGPDGLGFELPHELRSILTAVVTALRRGQAITLAPHALRLTTQQAAELLGVSRPTLIKLLESGAIAYETPNRHRRIRLTDLLTYQSMRRHERRDTLRELSRAAQDLGTYETPSQEYEAALTEARARLA